MGAAGLVGVVGLPSKCVWSLEGTWTAIPSSLGQDTCLTLRAEDGSQSSVGNVNPERSVIISSWKPRLETDFETQRVPWDLLPRELWEMQACEVHF